MTDVEELIRKYALKNAVKFEGEATLGAVMGKVMGECEECRKDPAGTKDRIAEVISEINELSSEEQEEELEVLMPEFFEEQEEAEIDRLPDLDAEGDVVMRLAPYPSGPLHIGNARMVILNDEYVKRNDGKLILFYDDTIGSEQKKPLHDAYDLIKNGLDWLGVECHETYYKSERMNIYYKYAKKIIEMGEAYVCECSAQELRKKREKGEECEHRNKSIDENLEHWEGMLKGAFEEGEATVRIKTDMKDPDPAFRDRVLFRISNNPHPKVGNKYHVWPLLEFSWAIDDHLLGMTHVLRGKDLVIEDRMEKYIWDLFGWEGPEFLHYGMLRVEELKLSKSDFQRRLKKGDLTGWDDPRTWSLQALWRRGIQPEAVRDFILDFGMSLTDIAVPASKLYAKNREIIDSRANRYYFLSQPVKIELEGDYPEEKAEIPRHPDFAERGMRKLKVGEEVYIPKKEWEDNQGKEVRLKNFCNIQLDGKKGTVTSIENKDILKIQWLVDGHDATVERDDSSLDHGMVEKNIDEVKENDIVQFERYGFVRAEDLERYYFVYGHR